MKQLIKLILQAILGTSLLVLIAGFIITYFFSENVEKKVITKIQEKMTSDVRLDDVTFSLYEKFPSASVKISSLLAFEKKGFNNDTLFYAKSTYIELSIIDIILSSIDIKKVVVDNGKINIKYDTENKPNFSIFKTNEKSKNKLILNNLILIDTHVSFSKKGVTINWEIQEGILDLKEESLNINAKLFSEKLIVNNKNYINKKQIIMQASLELKKDSILIQKGSTLHIENVKTELSGEIINGKIIDLYFSCKDQELNNIIKNTPVHLKSIYNSFKANGILNCNGNIKGLVSKESNPYLEMNCNIKKGNFHLKSQPFILKNVSLNSKINNGEQRDFQNTKIEISDFSAKTENGFIKGDFSIQNLNKYYLIAKLNSSWDLAKINYYFNDTPFFNLQGKLNANTKYSGYLSFDSKFTNYFLESSHTSKTNFKEVSFIYEGVPFTFNFNTLECIFKSNRIEIKNSDMTIADSDLNFTGDITDLIGYILKKKDNIDITGKLKSTYMKFDELISLKDTTKEKGVEVFPNWINADLNTNITNFSYNDFIASDITGQLTYKNRTFKGKYIKLKCLNGNIAGNFKLFESYNKLKLFSQLKIKQLNIRNAFLAFNNFNQDFITAEHIKGIGTAEIQMQSSWKPGFIFQEEDLKLTSHLIIEKGELIQFKPLESLSDYVSLEDLKTVRFSTLENTIEIDNKVVTIPTMEIKSSALSAFISGSHNFEQEINYRIKLLLSELMSTKFRRKNTQIKKTEFGEVNENGKIFNTIYFKMTGNSENPNILFDGIRFREDIKKGITKEKNKIKNIINEDILLNKKKEKKEKGQDIIIEWEDK
tara:strand:- start:9606 stop:12077 length:2472 start_codon:yes stop_codon:yes gene_type:complete